jgi:3D (Asp-Asp-Asp) domain-containing protein
VRGILKASAIGLSLLWTIYPVIGNCQPRQEALATITAYCLKGHTTSGPTTAEVHQKGGCIALSRKLAKDLGLYRGSGKYDYRFGAVIEVEGIGQFIFADLMPPKWRGYRVDIFWPSLKRCKVFGVKRRKVKVVRRVTKGVPNNSFIECRPHIPDNLLWFGLAPGP